jgi:hypothetical protein
MYTPEALAALRNNAKHFSSAASAGRAMQQQVTAPSSCSSAASGGFDSGQLDPEANLAALPRATAAMELGVGLHLGAPAGNFRASGRAKQLALQEADDLRRLGLAAKKGKGGSKSNLLSLEDEVAVAANEDATMMDTSAAGAGDADAMAREEELERLQQERQIRAAKLARARMRATGQLGAGEIAPGADDDDASFVPLSTSLTTRRGTGGESRLVTAQLDRDYGVAVRDEDEDAFTANSRLRREDADDAPEPEYDDEEAEVGAGGRPDRIAFGDPAARARGRRGAGAVGKGSQQIGALFNNSKPSRAGDSRRTALQIDDDDDDGDVVELRGPSSRRRKKQKNSMDDPDEDDDEDDEGGALEDDEETRAWEEELMRKGGAKVSKETVAAVPRKGVRASAVMAAAPPMASSLAQQIESTTAAVSASSGTVGALLDPVDIFRGGLATQLSAMSSAHDKLNARFQTLELNLHKEERARAAVEEKMEQANTQYTFYQRVSEQLLTSLECLSEKSRDIRAAWDEMHALWRARGAEVSTEEALHLEDLWREGGFDDGAVAAATSGGPITAAATKETQVDEFGRDISLVQESAADRRRTERQRWFAEQLQLHPIDTSPLGWRSLTPLAGATTASRFEDAVSSLRSDSLHIFSDTARPFRSLDALRDACEEWKRTHKESYNEAYMPASVAVMLAPYVQLELLQRWDLVKQPHFSEPPPALPASASTIAPAGDKDGKPDEDGWWYQKLFSYGMESGAASSSAAAAVDPATGLPVEDEDAHLLPTLIESTLVPVVHQFVSSGSLFDPLSLQEHVPAVLACIQEIEVHLLSPTTSAPFQALLTALLNNFQQRVAAHMSRGNDLVPQVDASSPQAARNPALLARQECYARFRFFRALALLASMTTFTSVLPVAPLKQLASQHVVTALLPFLAWKCVQVDTLLGNATSTAAAAAAAPAVPAAVHAEAATASSLVSVSPSSESALQQLQSMCTRFHAVFPQQWLQPSSATGGTPVGSMTQLYEALAALQQASAKQDVQLLRTTVQQMRKLLHR